MYTVHPVTGWFPFGGADVEGGTVLGVGKGGEGLKK